MKSIEKNSTILSVIVPIYNAEKYLHRCIRSIMSINVANIEILLINDGSEDNSMGICKELSEEDSRIKIFDNENLGVSATRNFGIKRASGRYIMFVDSDDYIEGDKISLILESIDKIDAVMFGYIREHNRHEQQNKSKSIQFEKKILNKKDIISCLNINSFRNDFGFVWNKLYNNDIIKRENMLFNESLSEREDLIFNIRYYNCVEKIFQTDLCVYHYIQNEDSLSRKGIRRQAIEELSNEFENKLRDNDICTQALKNSAMASVLTTYLQINIFEQISGLSDMNNEFRKLSIYKRYIVEHEQDSLFYKIQKFCFKHENVLLALIYYKMSKMKKSISFWR